LLFLECSQLRRTARLRGDIGKPGDFIHPGYVW